MSTRSRSASWFRTPDPFQLVESKAECLRGFRFVLAYTPPWTPYGLPVLPAARVWVPAR